MQRQQQNTGGTWGGAAGSGSAWLDPVLERPCGLCSEGAYCEMIDDMEDDGDSAIMFINGRSGNWYAFNDKTSSAQVPESDADYFTMVDLDPPRGRSLRAAWTKGEGFTDWGAGIGFDLRAKTPYDASQYAGVTFVGMSHEPRDMRFDIGDATTVPQAPICEGEQYCYDNFGRAVQLGTDWQRFRFDWQDLAQVGWGRPQSPAIDPSRLYAMRFQVAGADPFELWIDDVAFLCE
ncbi:MAG TPA: hypothetical protein VKZ49_03910 [Polyangiaceae bacterium]|nr:hypothetical protein [Polyangiaceae bacterium]